jgi:hypothetical protein
MAEINCRLPTASLGEWRRTSTKTKTSLSVTGQPGNALEFLRQ